jgi:DNA-binding transcriptional MerR regulator
MWTIDELGAAVELALAQGYEGAPSGRVRDVPDRRTIRYYTTLGLIDRPAAMRGRTALYAERHLLQLVAIKRLQASGLTLSEVQAELMGAPTKKLRELAALPEKFAIPDAPARTETARSREAFWEAVPKESAAAEEEDQSSEQAAVPALLQGIRLGEDLFLLFRSRRAIDEEDVRALERAARPLLRLLEARGLGEHREER